MFVVEAIYSFSQAVLGLPNEEKQQQKREQHEQQEKDQQVSQHKRGRTDEQEEDLVNCAEQAQKQQGDQKYKSSNQQKSQTIHYLSFLSFEAGAKIFVQQAYENGWWFGNIIGKPQEKGFFPSNYVKTGAKPLPPKPKQLQPKQDQEQAAVYDPQEPDWMTKKLQEVNEQKQEGGAVSSEYYHGIKGFKYVRIDDKNKNILNGNYVKFDVNTGLARVPVKDQAPAAKAVRQMGYYFDYHQWGEERNKNPNAFKARPDPKKKKPKKLNLKFMN